MRHGRPIVTRPMRCAERHRQLPPGCSGALQRGDQRRWRLVLL